MSVPAYVRKPSVAFRCRPVSAPYINRHCRSSHEPRRFPPRRFENFRRDERRSAVSGGIRQERSVQVSIMQAIHLQAEPETRRRCSGTCRIFFPETQKPREYVARRCSRILISWQINSELRLAIRRHRVSAIGVVIESILAYDNPMVSFWIIASPARCFLSRRMLNYSNVCVQLLSPCNCFLIRLRL